MHTICARVLCLSIATTLLFTGDLLAETLPVEFTVDAGKLDRVNVPVNVMVNLPINDHFACDLKSADGQPVIAQVTKSGMLKPSVNKPKATHADYEINFILRDLKAGKTASYVGIIQPGHKTVSDVFAWHAEEGKHKELRYGDRPVLRYMHETMDDSSAARREETFKVFHHVYDPMGKQIITKGHGGRYTHHRGLFLGFNKVNYEGKSVDIWHGKDAHQSHERFVTEEAGSVLGRHLIAINWHGKGKEVFANEDRELTVYNVPGGTLIEFASSVRPVKGEVKLDGDPQHAGFHFRASNEVNDKTAKQTYYLRPDGQGKPGETRNWPGQKEHVDLDWNAMSFVLGEQRYTVGYLDRPENPKEARFSERDYGRFGSYFQYTLTPDRPLELNYRVWVQAGESTVEQMNAHDANFDEPVKVTVKK